MSPTKGPGLCLGYAPDRVPFLTIGGTLPHALRCPRGHPLLFAPTRRAEGRPQASAEPGPGLAPGVLRETPGAHCPREKCLQGTPASPVTQRALWRVVPRVTHTRDTQRISGNANSARGGNRRCGDTPPPTPALCCPLSCGDPLRALTLIFAQLEPILDLGPFVPRLKGTASEGKGRAFVNELEVPGEKGPRDYDSEPRWKCGKKSLAPQRSQGETTRSPAATPPQGPNPAWGEWSSRCRARGPRRARVASLVFVLGSRRV